MTLMYPLLHTPIVFTENRINLLVVENAAEMRNVIENLREQEKGNDGEFVLGIRHEPADFSRLVSVVTDPFNLEANSRQLELRIQKEAGIIARDFLPEFQRIMAELNLLASKMEMQMNFNAGFTPLENPEKLIKLMNYYLETSYLGFAERLLEMMKVQRKFYEKELFVLYGIRAVMTKEERASFYREINYEKLQVLLVESYLKEEPEVPEKVIIIDKDLCVIS